MPEPQRYSPSPHSREPDLAPLRNRVVLGEPLDVLFRVLLTMRFGPERDGMVEVEFTVPHDEADALLRAMGRVGSGVVRDDQQSEQDCDRFIKVVTQVLLACEVAIAQAGATRRHPAGQAAAWGRRPIRGTSRRSLRVTMTDD